MNRRRRKKNVQQQQPRNSVSVSYKGPLPIASQYRAFEDAVPGTGERLTAMAERDQLHLHRMEEAALKGDQTKSMVALVLSFVLGTIFVVGGIYLLANGHATEGYLTGGITPAFLLFSYVTRFISQQMRRNRANRN
jgi:uncharacterized membrane protein